MASLFEFIDINMEWSLNTIKKPIETKTHICLVEENIPSMTGIITKFDTKIVKRTIRLPHSPRQRYWDGGRNFLEEVQPSGHFSIKTQHKSAYHFDIKVNKWQQFSILEMTLITQLQFSQGIHCLYFFLPELASWVRQNAACRASYYFLKNYAIIQAQSST